MFQSIDSDRPMEILLVEDNQDDVYLTREGFKRNGRAANVHAVENGELCLQFLRKQGEHAKAPTPDLILLDMSLPDMPFYEVSIQLCPNEYDKPIPIVVLTQKPQVGEALPDFPRTGFRFPDDYVAKPLDIEDLKLTVKRVIERAER